MRVDADLRGLYLDAGRHRDALALLSRRRLRDGATVEAFAYADRLCRLTRYADPRALILRAEAQDARGDVQAFDADVAEAFAIDPTSPAAARLKLRSAPPGERLAIARLILESLRADGPAIEAANEAVFAGGYELVVDLRLDGRRIAGAVAWRPPGTLELTWPARDGGWLRVEADRHHRLADERWQAAPVTLGPFADADEASRVRRVLKARTAGRILRAFDLFAQELPPSPPATRTPSAPPRLRRDATLTVVVPLYGDRRMTQLCLIALGRETRRMRGLRVILVNDNPADKALATIAAHLSTAYGFELLANPANLGFAQSINHALAHIATDDVLLLNADVLLPPGAIARLAAVAASAPDIGTVTPLANNGEEMSFPSPFRPGALEPFRRIRAIDTIAARENAGRAVTVVNGVGFCLLIKRRVLDALGPLPVAYERGYFEDVDYCLSARQSGLRNVCAANVYVGHKGSSSFRGAKRALVVRNRRLLEHRFPSYKRESAALVAADPLKTARAAIESWIEPPEPIEALVVVPPEAAARIATFLQALGARRGLLLTWSPESPAKLALRMSDGSCPQSLEFERGADDRALIDYLRRVGARTACLVGPVLEKSDLTERLHEAGFALQILFDDSFLRVASPAASLDCTVAASPHPCEACVEAFAHAPVMARRGTGPGLGGVLRMAEHVRPMNAMARAVADHFSLSAVGAATAPPRRPSAAARKATTMAVFASSPDVATERIIHALAREASDRPDASIFIFGPSLDAIRLMSWPNVFVTGPLEEDDLGSLLDRYDVDVAFAPDRWSGFGALERQAGPRPKGYFDWSGGLLPRSKHDLALDPRLCDRKVAYRLDRWWRGLEIAE